MNFRARLSGLAFLVASEYSTFFPSILTRVTQSKTVLLDGKHTVRYNISGPNELLGYGSFFNIYDVGCNGTLDSLEIGDGKKLAVIDNKDNLGKYLD